MLPEIRARAVTYDATRRSTRVDVHPGGGVTSVSGEPGRVLLGAGGAVVGVDVAPDSPVRAVVMAGPHESVTAVKDVTLEVARDAAGAVAWVIVPGVGAPVASDSSLAPGRAAGPR